MDKVLVISIEIIRYTRTPELYLSSIHNWKCYLKKKKKTSDTLNIKAGEQNNSLKKGHVKTT